MELDKSAQVRIMASWTISEYDRLFRNHPPTEPNAPRRDELEVMARETDHSPAAIKAQWDDARSAVLGNKTAASDGLLGYLRRRGWLR